MDPTFIMAAVSAVFGLSALIVTLWWLREPQPAPIRQPQCAMDAEPHTVIMLAPSGRPNPSQYERLPTYAAALARQRDLARQGRGSVITHADSGQVRLDLASWLGLYGRIGL